MQFKNILHISIYRNSIHPVFDLIAIMKKYRIDVDAGVGLDPPRNIIWVEEIVEVFGEVCYTERYKAISKNEAKRMKLYPKQKRGTGR